MNGMIIVDSRGNVISPEQAEKLVKEEGMRLLSENGRTFHTHLDCYKNWWSLDTEAFYGWTICTMDEIHQQGVHRKCTICAIADNDYERESEISMVSRSLAPREIRIWDRYLKDYIHNENVCILERVTGRVNLFSIRPDDEVFFEAEPDNTYDPGAIKVYVRDKWVGYLYRRSKIRRYLNNRENLNDIYRASVSWVDRQEHELRIKFCVYSPFRVDDFIELGEFDLVNCDKDNSYQQMITRRETTLYTRVGDIVMVQMRYDAIVVLTGYRDEIGELPPAACEMIKDKNLSLLVGTVSGYYEPDDADCIFTSIKLYDRKRKVVDGKEVEPDLFMI